MQTWFDRLRGITQGRIESELVTPPDGSHVFVLGEEQPSEESRLTTGDYTQIRQLVDLTNYDFVLATMDTIGKTNGVSITPPSWTNDTAELFKFYFDTPTASSRNQIIPVGYSEGFTFDSVGDIIYPTESYSSANTFCRGIPAETTNPTHLLGVHTPPVAAPLSTLNTYTLQMWVNFDVDSHSTSWGTDFDLMRFWAISGPNQWGIVLTMLGLTGMGAHLWYPFLTHYNGGASSGVSLDNLYDISTNQGWQLLTITYDSSLPAGTRVVMYLNGTQLGNPTFSINTAPAIPASNANTLQYGDQNCWGQLDSCRLLNRVLTPTEVATSYTEATTPGPTVYTGWKQKIIIDGEVYAERTIQEDESRRWTDFIAPVRRLTGMHEIAFRMELDEVT